MKSLDKRLHVGQGKTIHARQFTQTTILRSIELACLMYFSVTVYLLIPNKDLGFFSKTWLIGLADYLNRAVDVCIK